MLASLYLVVMYLVSPLYGNVVFIVESWIISLALVLKQMCKSL